MKTLNTILTFAVWVFLGVSSTADPAVTIGGQSFPIFFGDPGITESERARIADDLTNVFSVFSNIGDAFETNSIAAPLRPKSKSPFVYPEAFLPGPFAGVTNGNLFLFVDSALSSRYRQAFAFVETNQTAYSSLTSFIEELRSGAVTNRTHASRKLLVCQSDGTAPDLNEIESMNLAGSLFVTQPSFPSVLDAVSFPIGGVSCLSSASKIPDTDNGEPDASALVWVFHDNRWKWYCP